MEKEELIPARDASRLGYYTNEGKLNYLFCVFGDHIAEREGYKRIDGMEAIHFYLIHKFGWLPRDVKSMSLEDMKLVLGQEWEEYSAAKSKKAAWDAMVEGLKNSNVDEQEA